MRISEIFKAKKCVFSFEVFPPKKDSPIGAITRALDELCALGPDYISVTYGAMGTDNLSKTASVAEMIKKTYGVTALAHLTCVNETRETIDMALSELEARGVENVLALRGDRTGDSASCDFAHAGDLITYIKKNHSFCVSAACHPEGHPETGSVDVDIVYLGDKMTRGAKHLISQLFYDNNDFFNFMYKLREAGVTVPVSAGIMPVTNKKSIYKMASVCGAAFPKKFTRIMSRFEHSPQALFDAGIAYATEQIIDLVTNGVNGIHLYTMNNPQVARRINNNVRSIVDYVNGKTT